MLNRAKLVMLMIGLSTAGVIADEPAPVFPVGLKPGDTIAIVAPAGPAERPRVELARTRLEAMGFKLRMADDLYRRRGYLAGDDVRRAEELMAAFRDPQVDAIFCAGGGYGTTRMLDKLDYAVIRKNPKILTGFSDITALHLAIQRKAHFVTFHSPVAMYGLGSKENLSDFSLEYFWRPLLVENYFDADGSALPAGYTFDQPKGAPPVQTISPGVARGRLTGGNLSLVCPLMGTEFEIETAGRVLFLEDRNEEPYRIDRYLSQLRLAGKLDHLAGAILGLFTDCEAKSPGESLTLEQVFRDYFEKLGVPVILHFPVGHSRFNATLPMSVLVEVDAEAKRVTVLENPVRLAERDGNKPDREENNASR